MIATLLMFVAAPVRCQPDSSMAQSAFDAVAHLLPGSGNDGAVDRNVDRVEWIGAVDSANDTYLAAIDRAWYVSAFALVTCKRRVLGIQGSGQIDAVHLAHLTGGVYSDAVVEYVSGHGTGWMQRSFAILGLQDDSIRVLLDLVTTEESDDPAADGYYNIHAKVRVTGPGTIVREGKRVRLRCHGTAHCRETVATPIHERYLWDATTQRFVHRAPATHSSGRRR